MNLEGGILFLHHHHHQVSEDDELFALRWFLTCPGILQELSVLKMNDFLGLQLQYLVWDQLKIYLVCKYWWTTQDD